MLEGTERIVYERKRQIREEGFSLKRDLKYGNGELIQAARAYLFAARELGIPKHNHPMDVSEPPRYWPWPKEAWKPTSIERCLEKAGALIAAELDRLEAEKS
jgi:hypothetical protein